jgi:hypothetical protein
MSDFDLDARTGQLQSKLLGEDPLSQATEIILG